MARGKAWQVGGVGVGEWAAIDGPALGRIRRSSPCLLLGYKSGDGVTRPARDPVGCRGEDDGETGEGVGR